MRDQLSGHGGAARRGGGESRGAATRTPRPAPVRRRRRVLSATRGALGLLLCAAMVVALVPAGGMAWAAERDLEALAALGAAATRGDDGREGPGGALSWYSAPVHAEREEADAAPGAPAVPEGEPGAVGGSDDAPAPSAASSEGAVGDPAASAPTAAPAAAPADVALVALTDAVPAGDDATGDDATGDDAGGDSRDCETGKAYAALLSAGNEDLGFAENALVFMRVGDGDAPEEGADGITDICGNHWKVKEYWTGFEEAADSDEVVGPWQGRNATVRHVAVAPGQGIRPLSTRFWFQNFTNANLSFDLDGFDLTSATSIHGMFMGCSTITSIDVSMLRTPLAKDMSYLFDQCRSLKSIDLTGFVTPEATNMGYMFSRCTVLESLDISSFDVSKVTNVTWMFAYDNGLTSLTLGTFKLPGVWSMTRTFEDCKNLEELDLSGCEAPLNSAYSTFKGCAKLKTLDVSKMCRKGSISLYETYRGCSALEELKLPSPTSVTNYYQTFYDCSSLKTLDIAKMGTAMPAEMQGTFCGCSSLESLDVSKWNTSNVSTMKSLFSGCEKLKTLDVSGWKTPKVADMSSMFYRCVVLSTIDVSGWDTSNVTNMSGVFNNCFAVGTLDVSGWKTSKATNMQGLFAWCSNVKKLDVSGWDTSSVTNMRDMFRGCSKVVQLDLSSFDTTKVADMTEMLLYCDALASLDLGGRFSIAGVTDTNKLPGLSGLPALKSLYLGAWADYNEGRAASARRSVTLPGASSGEEAWWDASGPATPTDARHAGGTSYTPLTHQQAQLLWGSVAPGVYAGYDDATTTLTVRIAAGAFDQRYPSELSGTDWSASGDDGATIVRPGADGPARPWEGVRSAVTKVTFDGTNGKVRPQSLACWFRGMSSLSTLDLSGLDSSLATSLSHTFDGCAALATLDLSGLNVARTHDWSSMLEGCSLLSTLVLPVSGTSGVTSLSRMLAGCSSLASLDLSTFDTSGVTDMGGMLDNCTSLRLLELGGAFSFASMADSAKLPSLSSLSALESVYLGAWADHNAEEGHASPFVASLPRANSGAAMGWHDAAGGVSEGGASVAPLTSRQAQLIWGTATPGIYAKYDTATKAITIRLAAGRPDATWYNVDLTNTNWGTAASSQAWGGQRTTAAKVVFDGSNGKVRPASMGYWFYSMSKLAEVDLSGLDASQVTSMRSTFAGCGALSSIDVSALDTSGTLDMHGMFEACAKLTALDVSSWDTSKVTDMAYLFSQCSALVSLDPSGWDTSQVESMAYLFSQCGNIPSFDFSRWDTSKVTSMERMLYYCSSAKTVDVSGLDTQSVTTTRQMFRNCTQITSLDVSGFDMRELRDASEMFYYCSALATLSVATWETPKLENLSGTFYNLNLSTFNLSSLDTSHVTDMTNMVHTTGYAGILRLGGTFSIENVPDSKLPSLSSFTRATTIDLGAWGAYNAGHPGAERSVTLPKRASSDASSSWWDGEGIPHRDGFTCTPANLSQAKLTWSGPMTYARFADGVLTFHNGGSAAPDGYYSMDVTSRSTWETRANIGTQPWNGVRGAITKVVFDGSGGKVRPTYLARWFNSMSNLSELDLSGLDPSRVVSMRCTFEGCTSLVDLDLSGLETSSLTSLFETFSGCTNLESVNLAGLDSSLVTDMSGAFYQCSSLASLDLSRLDTSSVTLMRYMFQGCSSLRVLDLSPLDTSKVTNMGSLFSGCSSLETVEMGGQFSIADVDDDKLPTISGLSSLTSVYLGAWVAYNAGRDEAARRSVTLPTRTGQEGTWWDSESEPTQYQGGAVLVPTTAAQARLVWGTARPGVYARWNGDGTLLVKVSSGKPAGTGWYADDLLRVTWSSEASQPWADVRGQVSSVVFDGSGGKAMPPSMAYWFQGLSSATRFDLSGLDSSQAADLSHLFDGCASLASLDLSGFSTASATAMAGMFDGCSSLGLVTLGWAFDFHGAGSPSPLAALPNPDGEPAGRWARVADAQGVAAYDGAGGLTAAVLASSYDGSNASSRGTWEADHPVAIGGNGGSTTSGGDVQARVVSLDQLVAKALAAGLSRAYCELAGWSATAPQTTDADAGVPPLPWDATVADARLA